MFKKVQKNLQGSVLIFTLLLMSVLLLAALSLATTSIIGQKSARSTDTSIQAFQTADTGVERVLSVLNNSNSSDTIADVATELGLPCTSGVIKNGFVRNGESTYDIEFTDGTDPITDCSETIASIQEVKSTGEFRETSRAIKTAWASAGDPLETPCGSILFLGSGERVRSTTGCAADNLFNGVYDHYLSDNVFPGIEEDSSELRWIQDHCIFTANAGSASGNSGLVGHCYNNL